MRLNPETNVELVDREPGNRSLADRPEGRLALAVCGETLGHACKPFSHAPRETEIDSQWKPHA